MADKYVRASDGKQALERIYDGFQEQRPYTPTFGTVTTAITATQFASTAAKLVQIRAREGNAAAVSIGGSGVTTAAGYELAPGASTPWLPVANLNTMWYIGANTTDKADWIVLA